MASAVSPHPRLPRPGGCLFVRDERPPEEKAVCSSGGQRSSADELHRPAPPPPSRSLAGPMKFRRKRAKGSKSDRSERPSAALPTADGRVTSIGSRRAGGAGRPGRRWKGKLACPPLLASIRPTGRGCEVRSREGGDSGALARYCMTRTRACGPETWSRWGNVGPRSTSPSGCLRRGALGDQTHVLGRFRSGMACAKPSWVA